MHEHIQFLVGVMFWYIGAIFFGILQTTTISLTLDQVPRFRGSMMSINSAASNLGIALGGGLGGFVLDIWGYRFLGLTMGIFILVFGIIYYFLVIDPMKAEVPVSSI